MTGYKVCPQCGRQNPADAQWCASCGVSIANVVPPQQGYQQAQPNYGQQYQQPPAYGQAPNYGTKACPNCGNQIDARAEICPRCGMRVAPAPMQPVMPIAQKSEGVAAILSFFIPGLGQIYDNKIGRGLAILFSSILLVLFGFLLIPLIVLFFLWIWNIYDAYKCAERFNQQQMASANYQQYQRY